MPIHCDTVEAWTAAIGPDHDFTDLTHTVEVLGVCAGAEQTIGPPATWLQHDAAGWIPRPVKRVVIPKANGKRRGLGIPVIADRALQAPTVTVLEPEWEARFESRSYGFRPGRGCRDAMQVIFVTARGATCRRRWGLDADLAPPSGRFAPTERCRQPSTRPAAQSPRRRRSRAAWV